MGPAPVQRPRGTIRRVVYLVPPILKQPQSLQVASSSSRCPPTPPVLHLHRSAARPTHASSCSTAHTSQVAEACPVHQHCSHHVTCSLSCSLFLPCSLPSHSIHASFCQATTLLTLSSCTNRRWHWLGAGYVGALLQPALLAWSGNNVRLPKGDVRVFEAINSTRLHKASGT